MKNVKCFQCLFLFATLMTIISPTYAQTAVPMLINYQGEVRSPASGEPVSDGTYDMLFRVYEVEFGGTPPWEWTYSSLNGNPVEVKSGVFNVVFGSGTGNAIDASVFNGGDRSLEINVEMDTLEPRQRMTSVAYSITSENSHLLDGKRASHFAEASHAHSGSDITSGAISEQWIDPAISRDSEVSEEVGKIYKELTTHAEDRDAHHEKTTSFRELTDTPSDGQIPSAIARDSEIMPAVLSADGPRSGLDADLLDGHDSSHFVSRSSDYERSGVASNLYEGTETLTDKYINAGGSDSMEDSSTGAVLSVFNKGSGHGVVGHATYPGDVTNHGGHFQADGKYGRGVYGYSTGREGMGVYVESSGVLGRAVYGHATETGEATNYGGYFRADGKYGRGLHATASAIVDAENYGGYFGALGEKGVGVYGKATGSKGIGVKGEGTLYAFYAAGSKTNFGPFTGAHEVRLSDNFPADAEPGMIVSVTGETHKRHHQDGNISVSSTLPTVELSKEAYDKAVLGVFVAEASPERERWYQARRGERLGTVNALGDGRVWASNINGEIHQGDYITTSPIPGYGQRQDDDLLHSYTLGKAIESIDWNSVTETIEFNGDAFKVYLIAVIYTSE